MIGHRAQHPLFGVRLGKWERWLLRHAPGPEALHGLVLDDPDPGIREQLRRAACKLDGAGLLERHRMHSYVRARDPRREGLLFKDGQFWVRADQSRAHAVRRNVVWLSPFGREIELLYRAQLEAGAPIRWDRDAVLRARDRVRYVQRNHRRVQIGVLEEDARDAVIRGENRWKLRPAVPEDVGSIRDGERWEAAVAVARNRAPQAPAPELWQRALELWRTVDGEALRAQQVALAPATVSANDRFRRKRRPLL